VLAPNDYAFQKLGPDWDTWDDEHIKTTLQYHLLKGQSKMLSISKGDSDWTSTHLTDAKYTNVTNGQRILFTKMPGGEVACTSGFATRGTVIVEDLAFDDGLVQVVDSVMRVPEDIDSTARNAYADLTSLYATGLMRELAELKDVTVFAPRNAAFQQLAGTLEEMDTELLKRVLRYHIIPGHVVHAWELENDTELASASDDDEGGSKITVTRHANSVFANSAGIVQPDILIANGVVHLLDNVLNPDMPGARPDTSLTTIQPPVFSATGATATGTAVPTPFATYLPCTEGCAVAAVPTSAPEGGEGSRPAGNGGVAGARPGIVGTGVAVGMAVVVGVELGMSWSGSW
jgi:transforming growth factor-beta-induced protein